jgi:cbb3-type cytochrome oxidase maturation protein
MTVLAYLVPTALLIGAAWLATFLWSLSNGQYEDLDGAALRVLDDSDLEPTGEPDEDQP